MFEDTYKMHPACFFLSVKQNLIGWLKVIELIFWQVSRNFDDLIKPLIEFMILLSLWFYILKFKKQSMSS